MPSILRPRRYTQKPPLGVGLDGSSPLAQGLVGLWAFSEGGGSSVADLSGNGYTGTWSGTLGNQWGAGASGSCGVFDGTTNVVTTPASIWSALTGPAVSLSVWVNPTSVATKGVLGGPVNQFTNLDLYLLSSGSGMHFQYDPAGTNQSALGGSVVKLNVWTHLAVTYDGTTVVFYQNGVAQTALAPTPAAAARNTGGGLLIGRTNSINFFAGALGDVGLWNRGLSAAEVQALYLNPFALAQPQRRLWAVSAAGGAHYTQTLGGSLTGLGATLTKQDQKTLSGSLSGLGGATTKQMQRTLAGSLAGLGGVLARQPHKALAAALLSTAGLTRQAGKALGAAISGSGALVRQTQRGLAAGLAGTGALSRQTACLFGAALAVTGSVARTYLFVRTIFTASVPTSGTLSRQAGKALGATITATAGLGRAIGKSMTATLAPTGQVSRLTARTLGATLAVGAIVTTAKNSAAVVIRAAFRALARTTRFVALARSTQFVVPARTTQFKSMGDQGMPMQPITPGGQPAVLRSGDTKEVFSGDFAADLATGETLTGCTFTVKGVVAQSVGSTLPDPASTWTDVTTTVAAGGTPNPSPSPTSGAYVGTVATGTGGVVSVAQTSGLGFGVPGMTYICYFYVTMSTGRTLMDAIAGPNGAGGIASDM